MTEPLVRESVVVDGSSVSYQVGGQGPTLILIHGGSAHGGWWTNVAQRLVPMFRVVVCDLSGHGQSDRRDTYDPFTWAKDAAIATRAASGDAQAIVVGHSMGGAIGIYLAASEPDVIEGLILVDTECPPAEVTQTARRPHPVPVEYPTREALLERFRLVPPPVLADIRELRQLAEESITHTPTGWVWRHDPAARIALSRENLSRQLQLVKCPVGYIAGELSPISAEITRSYLEDHLRRPISYSLVQGAAHHVPVDAPEACANTIEDFVSRWLDKRQSS